MRKSKVIVFFVSIAFFNAMLVILSFMPYSKVERPYQPQKFELTKEQQIEKEANAEKLLQLKIQQKIAELEK